MAWLPGEIPSPVSWTHSLPSPPCALVPKLPLTQSCCYHSIFKFSWILLTLLFLLHECELWAFRSYQFSLQPYAKCLPTGRLQSDFAVAVVEAELRALRNSREDLCQSQIQVVRSLSLQVSLEGPTQALEALPFFLQRAKGVRFHPSEHVYQACEITQECSTSAFWKGVLSSMTPKGCFIKLCLCGLQKSFQTNGCFIFEVVIYIPGRIILGEGVSPSS